MPYRNAVLGGLLGAVAGLALWIGVAMAVHPEVGWLAPVVGLTVGFGAGASAPLSLRGAGSSRLTRGVLAGALTVPAVLAGNWVLVQLFVPDGPELTSMLVEGTVTDEILVSHLADDVVADLEDAGRTVSWPSGADPGTASFREEYPAEVWTRAEQRWSRMSEDERNELRAEVAERAGAAIQGRRSELRGQLVRRTFVGAVTGGHLPFLAGAVLLAFAVAAVRPATAGAPASAVHRAVELVMVEMVVADGRTDPEEVDVVREAFYQITGERLSEVELLRDVRRVETGLDDPFEYLQRVAPELDADAKKLIVTAAIVVATSDAEIQPEEHHRIAELVEILEMGPRELEAVLDELEAR